jgi:ATP-dependent Clp endopeptidase proteolytic subunit ClpP
MNEGHIFLDGEINAQMYEYFKRQLEANLSASKIILHISSPGGSVNLGYNIYHKLKNLPIQKECVIEGNCMSIATFIALACDKITALNPSRYMVHLPSMGIEGTRADLVNGAKELEQIEQEMIAAYQRKTNLPSDQLMTMMSTETYMSAEQARQYGFVDEVKNELKAVALGKSALKKGDKVKVKPGLEHDPGHKGMEYTVEEVSPQQAIALKMPDGMIHRWYTESELETIKTKMSNEKKTIFNSFREKLDRMEAMLFGETQAPQAASFETDKGMLTVDGEGPIEGKPATINGQPAPDGDYKLSDGKTITVSGGMITTVNEGTQPPPAPEAPEDKLKKMEAEFAALKAENEQLKSAQAAVQATEQKLVSAEQELVTVKASATQTREAFAQLKTEYESLEKKVVGDTAPPTGAKNSEKAPKEDEDSGMLNTKDFLKEYAPHLVNLKKS